MSGRVVKSVQRGVANIVLGPNSESQSINFSAVDLSKSIILFWNAGVIDNKSYGSRSITVSSTSVTFTQSVGSGYSARWNIENLVWQVIEFY